VGPGRRSRQTVHLGDPRQPFIENRRRPDFVVYEVGNGLLMAYRRKRITIDQITGFLTRLQALPIHAVEQSTTEILGLPALAQSYGLTNYDAAYLALASRLQLPVASSDSALRRAAASAGLQILAA
jgi:predicted nucleic acid-binding protein